MGFIAFILYSVILFFISAIFGTDVKKKEILKDYEANKLIRLSGRYFKLKEIVDDRTEDPDRDSN